VAVVLLVTSCQSSSEPAVPTPRVVDVAMREFTFEYDVRPTAGRVVFRARNLGRANHELLLVRLPEDHPPIREQLQSDKRRAVRSVGRVPSRAPGATGTFAVDLKPGRYAIVCFIADADGEQHAAKGMAAEFRVDGPTAPRSSSTTTAAPNAPASQQEGGDQGTGR
jgi:hypothetical protein